MSTGVPIENFSCFCDSLEFLLGVSVVVVHRCEEVPFEILPYAADGPVVVMDPGAAGLLLDKRGAPTRGRSHGVSRAFPLGASPGLSLITSLTGRTCT